MRVLGSPLARRRHDHFHFFDFFPILCGKKSRMLLVSHPARFIQPRIFNAFPGIVAAQSTRHGGVSAMPYHSLNLGLFTEDNVSNTTENRRRFFSDLDIDPQQVAGAHQVHGDSIQYVQLPGQYGAHDALVTDQPGVYLSVTVADCVPILLAAPQQNIVAAIHAGWRGTASEITRKTLLYLKENHGVHPGSLYAYIGTCIDGDHYEVGEEVAQYFAAHRKKSLPAPGKFTVDMQGTNRDQLEQLGVPAQQIECSDFSTWIHNDDFFSHRKEKGQTGRMLGLIGIRP
jgi:YfiH family protein